MPDINQEEIEVSTDQAKLERYQDLSGITVKKLNFGLWWVQNVKFFKRTSFWFLISLGFIGWMFTLVNFGYYLAIGMNKDDEMLKSMVAVKVNRNLITSPQALSVGDVQLFSSSENRSDLLVEIKNPNPDYYAAFDYSFVINGSTTVPMKGFILPGSGKYVMQLGLAWPENISTVGFSLGEVRWRRVNRHQIEDWEAYKQSRMAFEIVEPTIAAADASGLTEKLNISEISFGISNKSPFNYYRVPLNIFIYSFDRVVGVYQATVDNFNSGESRNLKFNYPGMTDRVDRVEVVPDLDIMDQGIYSKFKGE